MNASRLRDTSRWPVPNVTFSSIDSVPPIDGKALVTVKTEGAPLDALVDFAGSDITFISFHAAVSKARLTVPYFTGWSLAAGRANRVILSDPGLSESVPLSWFAGTPLNPASMIRDFIGRLFDLSSGASPIFFGSSGGGFAALNYARHFPGSTAIPVNPQTNILRFHRGMWTPYAIHAWDAPDEESAAETLRRNIDFDMTNMYAQTSPNVRIVYMQNDSDYHHVEHHFKPFLEANPGARLRHVGGNWGDGHKPAPRELLRSILDSTFQVVRGETL